MHSTGYNLFMTGQTARVCVGRRGILTLVALAIVTLLLGVGTSLAGAPEYMKVRVHAGMGIEVKVSTNAAGLLVADDIEALDKPRRPKLRGPISSADADRRTIVVFGMRINVTEDTEFDKGAFDDLRAGQRIEVKCAVAEDGTWEARQIATVDIKESNKVKGTITEVSVDGTPPDSIGISGLRILLVEETDTEEASVLTDPLDAWLVGRAVRHDVLHRLGVNTGQRVFMGVEYRHNVRSVSEFDLTQRFQSDQDDTQPELRVRLTGLWTKHVRTYIEGRARVVYVLSSDLNVEPAGVEFDLTQAFVLINNVVVKGVALQLGRQEFDDPREWIYDEYLNAARAYFVGSRFLHVELGLINGGLKVKYDTWTDVTGTIGVRLNKRNTVSAWMLTRKDSDVIRNREPTWWGLRYFGDIGRTLYPWLDAAVMRGEDKHRPLRAWAFDAGATLVAHRIPFSPSLTAGYAFGTGDETGGDEFDTTFRQTGYEDNSGRLGGVVSQRYYGATLDPELSNLAILTLGVGLRPIRGSSLEVVYHTYQQDWPDDEIRGNLVDPPARPNSVATGIGRGLDIVVGSPVLFNHIRAAYTFGVFEPGAAFAPRQEKAYMNKLNVTIRF